MPEPTIIYLRLVVNKADLIHLPARRKEQLIKTQMKGGGKWWVFQYWWQREAKPSDSSKMKPGNSYL